MQLTLHTDYSFRVLIYLYVNYPQAATATQISEYYGVSRNHLVKVVNNLGHLGLIETLRGKGGGMRLQDSALQMTAGEILRLLEGDKPLVDCGGGSKAPCCSVLPVCRFNTILDKAQRAFYAELDNYKLGDLTTLQPPTAVLEAPG